MTERIARIDSYFSLATDLAEGMRGWPEFVRGEGYTVQLMSQTEVVSISLKAAFEDDTKHVVVEGNGSGGLFEKALGYATYAMSAHSDSVWVTQLAGGETPTMALSTLKQPPNMPPHSIVEITLDALDRLFDRQSQVIDVLAVVEASMVGVRASDLLGAFERAAIDLRYIIQKAPPYEVGREMALEATEQLRAVLAHAENRAHMRGRDGTAV